MDPDLVLKNKTSSFQKTELAKKTDVIFKNPLNFDRVTQGRAQLSVRRKFQHFFDEEVSDWRDRRGLNNLSECRG